MRFRHYEVLKWRSRQHSNEQRGSMAAQCTWNGDIIYKQAIVPVLIDHKCSDFQRKWLNYHWPCAEAWAGMGGVCFVVAACIRLQLRLFDKGDDIKSWRNNNDAKLQASLSLSVCVSYTATRCFFLISRIVFRMSSLVEGCGGDSIACTINLWVFTVAASLHLVFTPGWRLTPIHNYIISISSRCENWWKATKVTAEQVVIVCHLIDF